VLAARKAARRSDVVLSVQQAVPAAAIARWTRRPLVLRIVGDLAWEHATRHGRFDGTVDAFQTAPLRGRLRRIRNLHRRAARRATRVLVPGDYLASIVGGWDVPADRIRVIPNALPPETGARPERDTARDSLGSTGFRILAVGRLVPWKGFHHLVRALAAMPSTVHLDVLGEGPEDGRLRALASDLGLEHRVTFHGALDRDRVALHLAAADVLALPSTYEGLSHVLLEAMASGCPAVTTDVAGNPEVVRDEREGLLVPPSAPGRLAAALSRLLRDDALRARMAEGALRRSKDFSHDRMVDATEALLVDAAES